LDGLAEDFLLLLAEYESVVHQLIKRLKIAAQPLDIGFQRL
jgi:hypothetical protein